MEIDSIGIDLGKTVFHLVGLNAAGEVLVRRKFRARSCCISRLICVLGGSAWKLAEAPISSVGLREQGHEVV